MTQTSTTTDEPCPDCRQVEGVHWVDSTPGIDTWACGCGAEWTITVERPGGRRD